MLNIFATTSQGQIKMNINLIDIPREEYIRYGEVLKNADFHIDNEWFVSFINLIHSGMEKEGFKQLGAEITKIKI